MSVRQVNGAGATNPCTDLVVREPAKQAEQATNGTPLLEGCLLPGSLQAVAVSYLNYSHEAWFPQNIPNLNALVKFNAAPEEATIDRLCKKAGGAWLQVIKTCHNRPHCASVTIAPRKGQERLFSAINAQEDLGFNLSPEQALLSCDQFTKLSIARMNYSDEELQKLLEGRTIDALKVYQCSKLKNLNLNLPHTRLLAVTGCNTPAIDARQWPNLTNLIVTDAPRGTNIDVRGLDCTVYAQAAEQRRITIQGTDVQGKDIQKQGLGIIIYVPAKKEGAQA